MFDKQFISLEIRLIGESEYRYKIKAKGIFNGRRHCMKTKVKSTSVYFEITFGSPIRERKR